MNAPFLASERWWVALLTAVVLAAGPRLVLGDPPTLQLHSAIYDPMRQSMVIFGGLDPNSVDTNDVWELGLDLAPQWAKLSPSGPLPIARKGHSAVYDSRRHRVIVFGGLGPNYFNDAWALSLTDPLSWDSLEVAGVPPTARWLASAVYDPDSDRVVIFGGQGGPTFGDTWSLRLSPNSTWVQLPVAPPPVALRNGQSAVYDSRRHRMVMLGGFFADVWVLSLHDSLYWRQLRASGTPPSLRVYQSAIYDSLGDRVIVFGGQTSQLPVVNDVWSLSLSDSTWSKLTPTGAIPSPRAFHSAVYDAAFRRMLIFGGAPNLDEPTWGLGPSDTALWSPLRPVVRVSAAELDLGVVTVGDTVAAPFAISNVGLEPLQIGELRLSTSEMRLSAPAPLWLDWTSEVPETLTMAAAEPPRNIQDSLVIVSNDPGAPRIRLRVNVRGLEFSTRILGSPPVAPLGASLLVITTPAEGVHVEGGFMYYRVAHTGSPFDSVALTPLGTDFIATIPGASVTERGVEYYVRVGNSGFWATRPLAASVVVDSQSVAGPTSFTAFARPTAGSDYLAGRDVEVEAELLPGTAFLRGAIHFHQGGDSGDAVDSLAIGASGRPAGTIPGSVVGPSGVEYWVEIVTLKDTLQYRPVPISTRVQKLAESTEHAGSRYRLLSVPLDFRAFGGSMDALLTDQLGPYDPVYWRLYSYDPVSEANIEFSSAEVARFKPLPGRAFWLISRAVHRVDIEPIDGFSTDTRDYTIALAQGWNLFGNPFDFPVAWADVVRDTDVVGDPVAFDGALGRIGDYAPGVPSALGPFEGYFIHATQPSVLSVPPRRAPTSTSLSAPADGGAPRANRSVTACEPGALPRFRLEAWNDEASDGSAEFGLRAAAARGFDRFDQLKPPRPPGPWVEVAFVHPDWQERSGAYRSDFRGPGGDGETWEIEVRSSSPGEPVTLDVLETAPLSPGTAIRIIDREQASSIDLLHDYASGASEVAGDRSGGLARYRIVPFKDRVYRIAIVVGTDAYVTQATRQALTVPTRLSLDPCAPNPFRIATRIRFALPRAARASLEIYSVLGQRVAKPLEAATLPAGYHTVIWDGKASNGDRISNGVYLMRLVVDGEALTGRLVLVR